MLQRMFSGNRARIAILISLFAAIMFIAPTGIFLTGTPASGNQSPHPPITGASTTYQVSFIESGLPSIGSDNVVWLVTLNGTTVRSDSSVITFTVQNGVYNYSIGNLSGLTATPSLGNVSVSSSDAIVNVVFSSTYYAVTFYESGLLQGAVWEVKIGNLTERSDTNQMVFHLVTGSYNYSISDSAGFYPSVASGRFNVSGNNLALNVSFSNNLEKIVFSETGLPAGTIWGVSITGVMSSYSNNSSVVFYLKNATYQFSIKLSQESDVNGVVAFYPTPSSGTVYANGSYHNISIKFVRGYDVLYFNETGLPSTSPSNVSVWTVNLSGIVQSSSKNSLTFYVANETYGFIIPSVGGYLSMYPADSITIRSNQYTEPVLFVQNYSYIKFIAKILPHGDTSFVWGVDINGLKEFTNNNTLIFTEPVNVSVTYNVLLSQGFSVLPLGNASKSVTSPLAGNVYPVNLSFNGTGAPSGSVVKQNYNEELQFFSLGLPYGSGYSVTLNASNKNITESSDSGALVTFTDITLGTYTYWVSSSGNYIPLNRSGNIDLTANNTTLNLIFTPYYFALNLSETGLPSGIGWGAGITSFYRGTSSYYSNELGDISAMLSNGSYYYFVHPVTANGTQYYPTVPSGFIPVNGLTTQIHVKFVAKEYPVNFIESGLPAGTPWGINVSGIFYSANLTGMVTINLPNGTYQYTVDTPVGFGVNISAGILRVNGHSQNVNIQFFSAAYSVNFVESGLRAGTNWDVQLSGTSYYSEGTGVVSINLENGTYSYVIPSELTFYVSNVSGGFLAVNGTMPGLIIYLKFQSVIDNLTISETDLPAGLSWDYSISGSAPSFVSGNSVTDELVNGTYWISFLPVFDPLTQFTYYPIPSLVYVNLNGSQTVTVNFSDFVYPVEIRETGLPSGAVWSAYIGGKHYFSGFSQIETNLSNGTYFYYVPNVYINYYPNVRENNFTIEGSGPIIKNVIFHQTNYYVNFTETGLGPGVAWNVTVSNSTLNVTQSLSSSVISFDLPNGSYNYAVDSQNRDYEPLLYGGSINVNAAGISVNVTFNPVLFNVTFVESGLATHTNWSVNFNGKNYTGWTNNSTSIHINRVFNGTYSYVITPISGYTETSGSPHSPFNVSGANVSIHAYFTSTATSPPPPPTGSSGFQLPGYAIVVIIAVAIVGAAVAAAVVMSQKKKKK